MSKNHLIPHANAGYVEVVFDGHEDWMSAVATIERLGDLIDDFGLQRILLDFTSVDMRLAAAEAPDVAKLFHVYAIHQMNVGIIRSGDARGDLTIEAFATAMQALGHGIDYVESRAAVDAWVHKRPDLSRRAG